MSSDNSNRSEAESSQYQLIRSLCHFLQSSQQMPGPIKHVETHISHIILAGDYAYKFKKPVVMNFLDYSRLDVRRRFCEEELRLNRRAAEPLYLSVVAITGDLNSPELDGTGSAIEYAVKMRRFPQDALFSTMLTDHVLNECHINDLAERLAKFHSRCDPGPVESKYATPELIMKQVSRVFEQLEMLQDEDSDEQSTGHNLLLLRSYMQNTQEQLHKTFIARKHEGRIREGHGDLHLNNIVWYNNQVLLFDCIEFDDSLRIIDVMSELAFVMMDLSIRNQTGLAVHLLNHYLTQTGDYSGLAVLRFYMVYRALVRAMVSGLSSVANDTTKHDAPGLQDYLAWAARLISEEPLTGIIIMHGVAGSGKSTLAAKLADRLGAIWIRSDVERKRLASHRLSAIEQESAQQTDLYSERSTTRTFNRLEQLARIIIEAGYPVIVDATFLRKSLRKRFRCLAGELGVTFNILACSADVEVLKQRILHRQSQGQDPSDANIEILEKQLKTQDELDENEVDSTVQYNASVEIDDLAVVLRGRFSSH